MSLNAVIHDLLNNCHNLDNPSTHLLFCEGKLLNLLTLSLFYIRHIREKQTKIIVCISLTGNFQSPTSDMSIFSSKNYIKKKELQNQQRLSIPNSYQFLYKPRIESISSNDLKN